MIASVRVRSSSSRLVIAAVVVFVVITALPAVADHVFQRVDAVELEPGENGHVSAVIDPAGDFAYFGTYFGSGTDPGRVVKIDLTTFERVGAITLESGEIGPWSAVIDPDGGFAYFGTDSSPGRVIKIDLDTFTRVGGITLDPGEDALLSAAIDPAGEYAYFGTYTSPGRVIKVDLGTFERVGAITLESGENRLVSAVIDPDGGFAYFGTASSPGRVVKIDLGTFERVGTITLDPGENTLYSAVIDPDGGFAYFGTLTTPGQVVKIDLATFQHADTIALDPGENSLHSAVIDPDGGFAYFGTLTSPGRVVKIDLDTFARVDAVQLETEEVSLWSAAIDPAGDFAYFGTDPGPVVKVQLHGILAQPEVIRLAGANRFETAAAVAAHHHPGGAAAAFIATGLNFPDALTGAAAAGLTNAPLLLTGSIPPATSAALDALDPSGIIVLGGSSVVSATDETALTAWAPVTRLAGPNRYGTAIAISQSSYPIAGSADTVVIATGQNFPDALAAAAAATALGGPVLLTPTDALPLSVVDEIVRLDPSQIIVVGGSAAVSDAVFLQLESIRPAVRIAGPNRYDTAVSIAQHTFTSPALVDHIYVAVGSNFPDALAGAAAAAATGAPVLLTPTNGLPQAVIDEIERLSPARIYILGGTAVVSQHVENQLTALLP